MQRECTKQLDFIIQLTNWPTSDDKLGPYEEFQRTHWTEEKKELIACYHLDQFPRLARWPHVTKALKKRYGTEEFKHHSWTRARMLEAMSD